MKKITTLSSEKILTIIINNKMLSEKFENYIYDVEMEHIRDKLNLFTNIEYSLGAYGHDNHLTVKNSIDFVAGVGKSICYYGCSDKLQKLYDKCCSLELTNLFDYNVNKLCELYYNEEICPTIKMIENIGYGLYDKTITQEMFEYLDNFVESYMDNVFINDENKPIMITEL